MTTPVSNPRLGAIYPDDVWVDIEARALVEDFEQFLPPGMELVSVATYIPAEDATLDMAVRMATNGDIEEAAHRLLRYQPACYAYYCTTISFARGPGGDLDIARRITERTGKPATTTSTAMIEAFHSLGISRVAVASPYLPDVQQKFIEFIEAYGIRVLNKNLLLLAMGYCTIGYFEYIFFCWIYYYFGEIRQAGAGQSAVYTTVLFLIFTIMSPIGGWISDRLVRMYGRKAGLRLVPIFSLTFSAALLYVGTNVKETAVAVALLSLAIGLAGASEAAFWAAAIGVGGKHTGAAGGMLNAGGNIGGMLAPVLTPYIASRAGWTWALHAGSLALMAGVVSWFFIDPTRQIRPHGAEIMPALPDASALQGTVSGPSEASPR